MFTRHNIYMSVYCRKYFYLPFMHVHSILFALIGFPLDKAVAYEKLRNTFVINDLDMQYCIQDRWAQHLFLKCPSIPLPKKWSMQEGVDKLNVTWLLDFRAVNAFCIMNFKCNLILLASRLYESIKTHFEDLRFSVSRRLMIQNIMI